jgi:hypothetical protein
MTTSGESETTGDELRQAAAAALADVDALNLEGDDRKIILKALLEARLGGRVPVGPTSNQRVAPDGTPHAIADGDLLNRMASVLAIDRDKLELVYSVENDEPTVVVSAKKVSTNKALATRQLGQLVAAARQVAGIEEWTSASTIRPIVQHYGRLDPNNFAATIQQMDDVCVIRGKGQNREVKLTKPGVEKTAELINTIVGADS